MTRKTHLVDEKRRVACNVQHITIGLQAKKLDDFNKTEARLCCKRCQVTADRWNAKNANSVNAIVAAATASEAAWQNMPTTVNELMTAAAHALEDRDTDLLEALQSHTRNWLQDDEAMLAQTYMLHTMLEAVYQLDD